MDDDGIVIRVRFWAQLVEPAVAVIPIDDDLPEESHKNLQAWLDETADD